MHITFEFAGLIAQVFPTLIVAILIEGRFIARGWSKFKWIAGAQQIVRSAAVLSASAATFACLVMFGSREESELADWIVVGSGISLMAALLLMLGDLLTDEVIGMLFARTGPRVKGRFSTSRQVGVGSGPRRQGSRAREKRR